MTSSRFEPINPIGDDEGPNHPHQLNVSDRRCACGQWAIRPGRDPINPDMVIELYTRHVVSHKLHAFSVDLWDRVTEDPPTWGKFGPKSKRIASVPHSRLRQLMGFVYAGGL